MELVTTGEYKTFKNHRQEPYFTYLKNGQKTIEGRINKKLYREIEVGDHIVVHNNEETDCVEVEVTDRRKYDSFAQMLEIEPVAEVLPDVETYEEAVSVYKAIYAEELEKEFGVVAIVVKLLV